MNLFVKIDVTFIVIIFIVLSLAGVACFSLGESLFIGKIKCKIQV